MSHSLVTGALEENRHCTILFLEKTDSRILPYCGVIPVGRLRETVAINQKRSAMTLKEIPDSVSRGNSRIAYKCALIQIVDSNLNIEV